MAGNVSAEDIAGFIGAQSTGQVEPPAEDHTRRRRLVKRQADDRERPLGRGIRGFYEGFQPGSGEQKTVSFHVFLEGAGNKNLPACHRPNSFGPEDTPTVVKRNEEG